MRIRRSRSTRAWTRVPLDGLSHDQQKIVQQRGNPSQKEKIIHATER